MKKAYVLDTSVLLHDPNAIFAFQENDVIIPVAVIEELDNFKRKNDGRGKNSREVFRILEQLRKEAKIVREPLDSDDYWSASLPGEGLLRIEINHQVMTSLPQTFDKNKVDNRILSVALEMQRVYEQAGSSVTLVTKDLNLRLKGDILGLQAEDYLKTKINLQAVFTGIIEKYTSPDKIDLFYRQKYLDAAEEGFFPNQFVHLKDELGSPQSALAVYHDAEKHLLPLRNGKASPWGIKARNREQEFAMELLLNEEIKLVTLVGSAGTGKTLLALAAGLQQCESNKYKKVLVSRPIIPFGNDIGFLPGDKEEKLLPWMAPIYDNLEYIFQEGHKSNVPDLFATGMIETEALTYIRGRSIPNQFIIIDEAQNLTPHEVKTILTRVGDNSKIVLTGDPYQIDNPYLDAESNGLIFAVETFKSHSISGHVQLFRGERSELAEIAAKLMML
jgi:PhoH-like ATPase